jgi:hypothetical protein
VARELLEQIIVLVRAAIICCCLGLGGASFADARRAQPPPAAAKLSSAGTNQVSRSKPQRRNPSRLLVHTRLAQPSSLSVLGAQLHSPKLALPPPPPPPRGPVRLPSAMHTLKFHFDLHVLREGS